LNRMPVKALTVISGRMASSEHYPPTDCSHFQTLITPPIRQPSPLAFLLTENTHDNTDTARIVPANEPHLTSLPRQYPTNSVSTSGHSTLALSRSG
jgi:hypothetical protein